MSQTQTLEIAEIPVDKIRPSPYQPRLDFDLEELRGSIIKYGIRDPLKIRQVEHHWELIDGERRWRIAKQEGIKTVPCLILKYADEEADALSWRFNTERKEYTLEERAKHFKNHQNEGLSGSAIGRIHGYSKQQVNRLLAIFRLPEKYQNYMWTGEFAFQKFEYLYGKGLINDKIVSYETEVIKIIDEAIERRLTQREFENIIDDYFTDLEKRQVEEAKKVATQLEVSKQREDKAREALGKPEVKEPETPEELERASEALKKEAEKRKTPEQRAEEKRQKLIVQARKSLNATKKKIDGASKIIDVIGFGERLIELENSLEQNPAEMREQLITLGKEVDESKKRRQREIEEEKRKKKEEEEKQRLEEEMKRKLEEEKKRLEEETRKRLETERKRIEQETMEKAKEELLRDPSIILQAKAMEARSRRLKEREAERAKGLEIGEKAKDALDSKLVLMKASIEEMVTTVKESSVDVIITDPPYSKEYLECFSFLAHFAFKALKPGKPLLVMVGQSYLPEVFRLLGEQMSYHWTLAYLTPGGQSPQIWPRKINTFWKPVIWLTKGKYEDKDWHGDVFKSDVNDNDKRFHHWGQSESGISRLVEAFSKPDDVVCDPFLGGGTTAVVAIRLGRKFIGSDIDENALETCRRRVVQSYE